SSADAAHLLVAAVGVDFGFEADAVRHGGGERVQAGCWIGVAAEQVADFDFAAFEEAGAEDAVGGEAEAIAGGAEGGGHGADEGDASARGAGGEAVGDGGTDAGFELAIDGEEGAELLFDTGADLGFGDEGVLAAVLGAAAGG